MRLRYAKISLGALTGWRSLLLLLLLAAPALAAEPNFPRLTGRVVDEAGILSDSTCGGLTEMLARHERATGEQVVVVTLKSLQGYAIEDFGYQLGRRWGIGQKDKNTGALLIVAPTEHKIRIEVGYGLEGKLTDATSRTIIERDIVPAFRRGDYNAGVIAGAASILTVLGDASAGAQSGIRRSADRGINFSDPMLWRAALFMGGWGLMFFLMFLSSGPDDRHGRKRYMFFRSGGSPGGFFGGGGFGGGGFSGGGFSGGGGSFGGGGASGGW